MKNRIKAHQPRGTQDPSVRQGATDSGLAHPVAGSGTHVEVFGCDRKTGAREDESGHVDFRGVAGVFPDVTRIVGGHGAGDRGVNGDGGVVEGVDVGSACVDEWRVGYRACEYGVSAAWSMIEELRAREKWDGDNRPTGVVEFSILPFTEYPSICMLHPPCWMTGTDTNSPVCLVESRLPSVRELFSGVFVRPRWSPNSGFVTDFCSIKVSKNPATPVVDFVQYPIPNVALKVVLWAAIT